MIATKKRKRAKASQGSINMTNIYYRPILKKDTIKMGEYIELVKKGKKVGIINETGIHMDTELIKELSDKEKNLEEEKKESKEGVKEDG